jgi:Flp pilus assembly protein TadG
MKIRRPSERGQAIILIVLSIVGLLGLTALAVDGGNAYSERRRAQNAADTTVLDAALAKLRGQNLYTEGLARAASNKYVDSDPGAASSTPDINVEIYNPPISGENAGKAEYIQAFITATIPTYFGKVIGIDTITNKVEAVARAKPPIITPPFSGNAIVGLAPTECKAITYQGNANTTVTGGGIFTNSKCDSSAFFNNSSSAKLSAPCLQTVGGITYNPGALNIPPGCVNSGVSPIPAPVYPNPTCDGPATKTGNVLSGGSVPGNFPPAGVTVLNPGIYCVGGNFQMNATETLTGHGVVIRVETGYVRFNGSAHLDLSAPTSGPFVGLLLFLPEGNNSVVEINGDNSSIFTGSIIAPSANISINGTGALGLNGQVIGWTVNLSGTSAIKINYNAGTGYQAPEQPAVQLVE